MQEKRNIEDSLLRDGGLKKKDDGSDLKRTVSNQEPKLMSLKIEKPPEKVVEDQSEEVKLLKASIEAFKQEIQSKDD